MTQVRYRLVEPSQFTPPDEHTQLGGDLYVAPDESQLDTLETQGVVDVLELLKAGRDTAEPWGRVNPLYVRQNTDLDKGQVEYALRNFRNAGWVRQLNSGGLYEFVEDPREDADD